MSNKGTIINAWTEIINAQIAANGSVTAEDAGLIRSLAINIISNWEREAATELDQAQTFASIYEDNKTKAAGLIVAILEVVHNIGGLVDVQKTLVEKWD